MLSNAVYRDLTLLVRYFSLIRQRIDQGAQPPEIDLLIEAADDALHRLAATIGAVDSGEVGKLARHLHFIGYYFARGNPDGYAHDIEDITQRDLPAVIELVGKWEEGLLSPGLVEAISRSWRDHNYVNVVRDAFVYLEEALRSAGRVPASEGLANEIDAFASGAPLSTHLGNIILSISFIVPGASVDVYAKGVAATAASRFPLPPLTMWQEVLVRGTVNIAPVTCALAEDIGEGCP